jgi:molybdopterin/thiamine biosynthesis adenylyltransferase
MTSSRRSDRFERTAGLVDVDGLAGRRVVVVGLGSGGSTVALELAKASVSSLTLIDPDRIEEPNLIRHECDDRYVGWNKAEAVADLIAHRNPDAGVDAIAANALSLGPRLEALVETAALVVPATDAEAPKHLLNRLCVAAGVPAVFAGVYERGVGGEIIRCEGGPDDACYACVTSVLKQTAPVEDDAELDYGAVDADGVLHGAPGLGLDVRLVALLHAKLCLLTLARGTADAAALPDLDGNVVLFGNAPVDGVFPRHFASAVLRIAPQADCLVCRPFRESREAATG